MKKQYPKVVVMRKKLIFIAMGCLIAITSLIIFNLWREDTLLPAHSASHSDAVHDFSGEVDTAWFKDARINQASLIKPSISAHPLPTTLVNSIQPSIEDDKKAMQAAISSNQIKVDINSKNLLSSADLMQRDNQTFRESNLRKNVDTNGQAENKDFINQTKQGLTDYSSEKVKDPMSPYEIKTGTIIPATLISGINSDLPGPIIAQVRENVYDTQAGSYVLIPQGAKLQGVYDSSISYGQQRVLIVWQRVIFPNGQSLKILGMPGADVSGYAGFKDQVNNHYTRIFGSAIMMSLISAGAQLSQPQQSNLNNQPSINQMMAQNLGISLSQTADQLLRKNLNVQPTLEIRPGYLFNIILTQDLQFPAEYR